MNERAFHLFATLLALAGVGGNYAHARVTTKSGSTYVVEMAPNRTTLYTDSAAIGRRDINVKDVFVHNARLHVAGCDPKDSLVTSRIEALEIKAGSVVQVPPSPQEEIAGLIFGAFGAR